MDSNEFRQRGKEMVDFVADYLDNIRERQPRSGVAQGYMRGLLPTEAPRKPEAWHDLMADVERVIMPGVSCRVFVVNSWLP